MKSFALGMLGAHWTGVPRTRRAAARGIIMHRTDPREAMLKTIERHARSCREALGRNHIDPRVLEAMRRVPRERFVPAELRAQAYADSPLPIGHGQTISQPFIVALMTDLLDVQAGQKVLEVGTGCGYQAAVLAELGARVLSIEIVAPLAEAAARTLAELGYGAIDVQVRDGHQGLPEAAPFDRIIVTAAPDRVPEALLEQLALGGRMVIPVGGSPLSQELLIIDKDEDGTLHRRPTIAVSFVPLTGAPQARDASAERLHSDDADPR